VTPEAKVHLDRAGDFLRRADAALLSSAQEPLVVDDAARNAYYSAFHAATALIFERTRGTVKKHGSVHRAFIDVTRHDATVDGALKTFLTDSYRYKLAGDYGTDPSKRVTEADARSAVAEAKRFVTVVAALLP
jgi:uncharacterized protein (UPF0332 family)